MTGVILDFIDPPEGYPPHQQQPLQPPPPQQRLQLVQVGYSKPSLPLAEAEALGVAVGVVGVVGAGVAPVEGVGVEGAVRGGATEEEGAAQSPLAPLARQGHQGPVLEAQSQSD